MNASIKKQIVQPWQLSAVEIMEEKIEENRENVNSFRLKGLN